MLSTAVMAWFEDARIRHGVSTTEGAAHGTSMMLRQAGNRTFEDAKTGHRAGVVASVLPRHFPDTIAVAQPHVRGRDNRISRRDPNSVLDRRFLDALSELELRVLGRAIADAAE
jgi:hypothetical protein